MQAAAVEDDLLDPLRPPTGVSLADVPPDSSAWTLPITVPAQLVAAAPPTAADLDRQGLARLHRGNDQGAIVAFTQALRRDPDNKDIQLAMRDALKQAPKSAVPHWDE